MIDVLDMIDHLKNNNCDRKESAADPERFSKEAFLKWIV
jgi:hypothetical protein